MRAIARRFPPPTHAPPRQAINAKFNDMVNEADSAYRQASVGLVASLLEKEAASSSTAEMPEIMSASSSGLNVQGASFVLSKDKAGSPDDKAEGGEYYRRCNRFALSSDEEDAPPQKKAKVASRPAKKCSPGKIGNAAAGGGALGGQASKGGEATCGGAAGTTSDGAGAVKRGRKAPPIEDIAEQHLRLMQTADAGSNYFNEQWSVMQRSIGRYASLAGPTMMQSPRGHSVCGALNWICPRGQHKCGYRMPLGNSAFA